MVVFLACGAFVLLYFLFFGLFDRSHPATVTVFALFFSGYAFLEAAGWLAASSGVAVIPLLLFATWAASNVDVAEARHQRSRWGSGATDRVDGEGSGTP